MKCTLRRQVAKLEAWAVRRGLGFAPVHGLRRRGGRRQTRSYVFFRAREEIGTIARNPVVMARLDRAIHKIFNEFSVALDGRVKPGHDSGAPWT